ncbi:MAG: glutamyl-tRNA amidotransferase, partial [Chitinophagaceae bacterium]|nr:glutamyl-tRNA amidotransferase [Chitinophagaceae bacterium]
RGLGALVDGVALPRQPIDYCRGASHIIRVEGYANLRDVIETETEDFGPAVRARVRAGRAGAAVDYAQTLVDRRDDTTAIGKALEGFDALLLPTTIMASPPLDTIDEDYMPLSDLTRFVNYLGLCALALPCGFNAQGLPMSLQIVGKAFTEDVVLRIGLAYEEATGWHLSRPDLTSL